MSNATESHSSGGTMVDTVRPKAPESLRPCASVVLRFTRDGKPMGEPPASRTPWEARTAPVIDQPLTPELAELFSEYARRASQSAGVESLEYGSLGAQGEQRLFEALFARCGDDEIVALVRDVTALRKSAAHAQQLSRIDAATRLARGATHEFSNVLTVVHSYTSFIRAALPEGDQAIQDADMVLKAVDEGKELIERLSMFARSQVQRKEPISLNQVVKEVRVALSQTVGDSIQLTTSLTSERDRIHADPALVTSMLLELARNARDAMPYGGTLGVATSTKTVQEATLGLDIPRGNYVVLEVADNGVGMTEDARACAVEPFFTTRRRENRDGLGLSVVYGAVTQYGGFLSLDSAPGVGTRVSVSFPAK